ncbi:MAG: chorismate synthase [Planctomycetota bacterium]
MNPLTSRLSFRTAGESHGGCVVAMLEGLPRGLLLDTKAIDAELRRRQGGAGRGGRQRMEHDAVKVLGGLRRGRTIGSPLCLLVENRDATIDELPEPTRPRPGHADLAGCYRWLDRDIRSTLERASARETCARVLAGAVAMQLLATADTVTFGFVRSVHRVRLLDSIPGELATSAVAALRLRRDATALYTLDAATSDRMLAEVQEAGRKQDTVGGIVEVRCAGLLPGLGSCLQWHERLDARLAAALMSIPAIKAVEIGDGIAAAALFGSEVHDPILPFGPGRESLPRSSNHAGGLEAGMTNGENLVVRAAMKPISTLPQPLPSVDLADGSAAPAGYERSDLCAVSAASVVAESMVSLVLADALLARVGGETMDEFGARLLLFRAAIERVSRGSSSQKS